MTLILSLLIIISTALPGVPVKHHIVLAQKSVPFRSAPSSATSTNSQSLFGQYSDSPKIFTASDRSSSDDSSTGGTSLSIKTASTGESHFSGTSDVQLVHYTYCKNPNTNDNDECRYTFTGHSDFQGTLDYFGRFPSGADVYNPSPNMPMGTCHTNTIIEDLTIGTYIDNPVQLPIYGYNPSGPIPQPGTALENDVQFDTIRNTIYMYMHTHDNFDSLCGELIGSVSATPNNGIVSGSGEWDDGGPSISSSDTGLPEDYGSRSNHWDVTLVLPPCDPNTQSCPQTNNPPIANAGPDQTVNSGDSVTLDGSASFDHDSGDSISSYKWSSSDPSIQLGDGPNPTFTAPDVEKDTTFTIQLVVTDTHDASSEMDTVDILVKAPPPPPPPCVTSAAAANPNVMYSDSPLPNNQLPLKSDQCKQLIKVKGKIFVETPGADPKTDRGNIPIRNLQVELCSPITCIAKTNTDSAGNYVLSTDQVSDTKNLRVVATFLDIPNHMFASQYDPTYPTKDDPAKIMFSGLEFKEDPSTTELIANADVKFSARSPWLLINDDNLIPSQLTNIDKNKIASLAAIYYYIDRSLDYSSKNISIAQTYNPTLNVKVFDNTGEESGVSNNLLPISLNLDLDDSNWIMDPDKDKVETAQDNIFHEVGHYLIYELNRGFYTLHPKLHPDYLAAAAKDPDKNAKKENCHHGYAQLDSTCAMDEAKATFLGLILAENVLDDPGHSYYKKRAMIYNQPSGGINMEETKSIAGLHNYQNPKNIEHSDNAEEDALTSLLWDFYDDTPSESLPYGLGKENIHIPLSDITNSLYPAKSTSLFYKNLISAHAIDTFKLDSLFAAFDICKDVNGDGKGGGKPDGKCETTEVKDGLSTWKVKYRGHTYGYPDPDSKYPDGRP